MVQIGLGIVVDTVKLFVWHLKLDHLLPIYLKFVRFIVLESDRSVIMLSPSLINRRAPFIPAMAVSLCLDKASQYSLLLQ